MDVHEAAMAIFDIVALKIRRLKPRRHQDAVIRHLVQLIDTIDVGPADREEIVDDWPHARPRQVEGMLDAGMFDFALARSIRA